MRRHVLVFPLCLAACVNVADERAEHDSTIGRARAAGLTVEVQSGLAHVRALEPGRLELWAQAPALEIALDAERAGPWQVELHNVLADAELAGTSSVTLLASPRPTKKTWQVDLPAGRSRLQLAPPDALDTSPWRFGIFADVQEAVDDVQDIFGRMNADPSLRFVLMSGDLTERGTPEQLERFEAELRALHVPVFATLGNHELGTDPLLFHRYFGRGSFSFEFRGLRFTLIDDASATIAPRTYDWLDGWLTAGQDRAHVVLMHLPPLDPVGLRNGAFASRAEAGRLLTTLADGDVDLTVYGHVHSYYAFENAGIPAYISGGGGAIPERLDGIARHYLAVDVEPEPQRFEVGVVRID